MKNRTLFGKKRKKIIDISREEIESAMKVYFASGGKISYLSNKDNLHADQ